MIELKLLDMSQAIKKITQALEENLQALEEKIPAVVTGKQDMSEMKEEQLEK